MKWILFLIFPCIIGAKILFVDGKYIVDDENTVWKVRGDFLPLDLDEYERETLSMQKISEWEIKCTSKGSNWFVIARKKGELLDLGKDSEHIMFSGQVIIDEEGKRGPPYFVMIIDYGVEQIAWIPSHRPVKGYWLFPPRKSRYLPLISKTSLQKSLFEGLLLAKDEIVLEPAAFEKKGDILEFKNGKNIQVKDAFSHIINDWIHDKNELVVVYVKEELKLDFALLLLNPEKNVAIILEQR